MCNFNNCINLLQPATMEEQSWRPSLYKGYVSTILHNVWLSCIISVLPSRLASMESKPVPAPISSTALSIRFTWLRLFSRNWHKATACRAKSHHYTSYDHVSEWVLTQHRGGAYTPGQIRAPKVSIDSWMLMSWPAKWKDSFPRE